jgi:hypothetical protein
MTVYHIGVQLVDIKSTHQLYPKKIHNLKNKLEKQRLKNNLKKYRSHLSRGGWLSAVKDRRVKLPSLFFI